MILYCCKQIVRTGSNSLQIHWMRRVIYVFRVSGLIKVIVYINMPLFIINTLLGEEVPEHRHLGKKLRRSMAVRFN